MPTLKDCDRQYENRFDEKCQGCGLANLWRKIEWANKKNDETKRATPSTQWQNPNVGFIFVKYCHDCKEKNDKKYILRQNNAL